ncbi:MAG: adenine phosphoribosyltransferase [Candidatus Omnitrophica bacterium]|nr:adenine phosphoribosyltransferase [Candidatus Omnitrophota bacterium]
MCFLKKRGVCEVGHQKKGEERLSDYIRAIPDFPKPGILFRDITTLLQDGEAFHRCMGLLTERVRPLSPQKIVAVEARGFIFGGALAQNLGCGFVPVRKRGKLPYTTKEITYDLEYGTDTLAIHEDALKPGEDVVLVDDLLATGGTMRAVVDLLESMQADILSIVFLIELSDLKGRERLKGYPVESLVTF